MQVNVLALSSLSFGEGGRIQSQSSLDSETCLLALINSHSNCYGIRDSAGYYNSKIPITFPDPLKYSHSMSARWKLITEDFLIIQQRPSFLG